MRRSILICPLVIILIFFQLTVRCIALPINIQIDIRPKLTVIIVIIMPLFMPVNILDRSQPVGDLYCLGIIRMLISNLIFVLGISGLIIY